MLSFVQHVCFVGMGGIGGWCVPPLLRFLHAESFAGDIVLVDGDAFTLGNMARQDANPEDTGEFKADVFTTRLLHALPGLRLRSCPEFITVDNVARLVPENSLVLSAVDNHPARAVMARHAATLQDACILSAGNDLLDGNVHITLRRAGKDLTIPLLERHTEIATAKSGDRSRMGCEDLIAAGRPQLLVTNFLAAAALFTAFYCLWDKEMGRRSRKRRSALLQEVYFDVRDPALSALGSPVHPQQSNFPASVQQQ